MVAYIDLDSLRALSEGVLMNLISNIGSEITHLKSPSGLNELDWHEQNNIYADTKLRV